MFPPKEPYCVRAASRFGHTVLGLRRLPVLIKDRRLFTNRHTKYQVIKTALRRPDIGLSVNGRAVFDISMHAVGSNERHAYYSESRLLLLVIFSIVFTCTGRPTVHMPTASLAFCSFWRHNVVEMTSILSHLQKSVNRTSEPL